MSRAEDCQRFVDEAVAAFGGVDILINNAGTSAARGLEEVDDDAWYADLDLKLMAAVRLCRAVVPIMRARGGGAIVNATIVGGKAPPARGLPTRSPARPGSTSPSRWPTSTRPPASA